LPHLFIFESYPNKENSTMYSLQITHLDNGHVIQMLVNTSLVNPFTYGGVTIEKVLGTDCVLVSDILSR